MKITEDKIEDYRTRITEVKNIIAQKQAKRDLLRVQLNKIKKQFKELGVDSIKEAKQKVKSLENKIQIELKSIDKELRNIEDEVYKLDE